MNYQIIKPPDCVRSYVRYFWTFKTQTKESDKNLVFKTFVDDSSGMMFRMDEPNYIAQFAENTIPAYSIYGQTTRPTITQTTPVFQLFGVLFEPHTISELFGIKAAVLTDTIVDATLFIQKDLINKVTQSNDIQTQINIVSKFIQYQKKQIHPYGSTIHAAIERIKMQNGNITVFELTKYLNISERTLERVFGEIIGISPRHLIKVIRFQKALWLMKTISHSSLTEIAHQTGYADQSHFVHHTKQLSGFTPKELQTRFETPVANLIL